MSVGTAPLAVTLVGLFGTLGRTVIERRQELAIRAAVAGLVVAAALAASIIPALRAARLDPLIALRAE